MLSKETWEMRRGNMLDKTVRYDACLKQLPSLGPRNFTSQCTTRFSLTNREKNENGLELDEALIESNWDQVTDK
jgi:hypothetical protein